MMKYDKLTINSEIFDKMCEDFNAILQNTVAKMIESKNSSADISVTLSLDLYDKYINYEEILNEVYTKPIVEHKVSSVIKRKTEKKGLSEGEYAIMWDEESKSYVLKKVEDIQTNLTDNIYRADEKSENNEQFEAVGG